MKAQIKSVPLRALKHNPHRLMATYPISPKKVESLKRSIEAVGLWESIIVREKGAGYQIAFGHHRVAALKELKIKEVNVILKDLDDKQMLEYLGRENGEDYNTEFLIMLNTWEAGVKFIDRGRQNSQPVDIARLLGWTVMRDGRDYDEMDQTANACNAAYSLISGGYLSREDLDGMSVRSARDICQQTLSRHDQMERMAAKTNRPRKEVQAAKKDFAKGAKAAARALKNPKDHSVTTKNVGRMVDPLAYKEAKTEARKAPLLEVFLPRLARSIGNLLDEDQISEKLKQVADFASQITEEEHKAQVRRVQFQLGELSNRAGSWSKRIEPKGKVIKGKFKALPGGAK